MAPKPRIRGPIHRDKRAKRKNKRPGPGHPQNTSTLKREIKCEEFADLYMSNGMNATQAARDLGTKESMAPAIGHKLLNDSRTQRRIGYLRRRAARRGAITVDRIIAELAKIAFADMRDFVYLDENGEIYLDGNGLDDHELSGAISEIAMSVTGSGKNKRRKGHVRLHDKGKALKDLGVHLGMWPRGHGGGWGDGAEEDDGSGSPIEITIKGGLPAKITKS